MSINFPTSLDSLPNPTSTDLLENATLALDHDQQHANANDAIEALEAKVGVDGSAVTTSHDYKLSGVTGSDKAVSKTGTETLTNKTLTSPVINVGSDATGDIYYRSAGGIFTRLAAGAADTILAIQAGLPAWISNPSAADSSYSVKGIVRFLTDAATSGITIASGVANVNTGTGANQIVKLNSSAELPAVSAVNLTNIPGTKLSITTTDVTSASSTAENTVISYSLAGGVLSTNNAVKVTIHFSNFQATTTSTVTLRFKYGGTTLVTKAIGGVETYTFTGKVEFILAGAGTTGTQNGSVFISLGADGYIGNGNLEPQYFSHSSQGTSSIDSTTSQTLLVTAQCSNNGASDGYTASMIVIDKIV